MGNKRLGQTPHARLFSPVSRNRQADPERRERRAALETALDLDVAAVPVDNPARNGQTQPGAAQLARTDLVRSPEAVEYVRLVPLTDSDA